MSYLEDKHRHDEFALIDLRAHATAVGFVQLCVELRRNDLIEEASLDRIKEAIAGELLLSGPKHAAVQDRAYRLRLRLDRLFSGAEAIGPVRSIPLGIGDSE